MVRQRRNRATTTWVGMAGRLLVLLVALAIGTQAAAQSTLLPPEPASPLPAAVLKATPSGVDDLAAIQQHVRRLVQKVVPCTVGVRVGGAQGSGVIISPDGYVLTAGHVSGAADRNVTVILADGRTVRGKTLGANRDIDSGLIKITGKHPDGVDFPHVFPGVSNGLKAGGWCLSTGHPGGFQPGRSPVVRLGRLLRVGRTSIVTDCTLVGGDSGGPLFDMDGNVIGIHSRIGAPLVANIHVPVDTYVQTWDRLAKSEVWGGRPSGPQPGGPYVGVNGDPRSDDCRIGQVLPDTPAAKAGIKAGDVIRTFSGATIKTFEDFAAQVRKRKPGDKIPIEVFRNGESVALELVIGRAPG
jgi:serine protease Do